MFKSKSDSNLQSSQVIQSTKSAPIETDTPIYICINCGSEQILSKDIIKCKRCNHKIFFKKRFQQSSFYLAR